MGVLATDDFNRANSTGLGANWAAVLDWAMPDVASNQCVTTGGFNVGVYTAIAWPNDQYSKATIKNITNSFICAVAVRHATDEKTGYYGGADPGNFDLNRRIWKRVADSQTSLASEAVSIAVDDVIYIEAQGTTIKLFVNAVEELSTTDATIASGNAAVSVREGSTAIDDWEGGDFAAGGDDGFVAAKQYGGLYVPVRSQTKQGFHALYPVPILTSLADVSWLPWFPGVIKTIYSPTPSGEKPLGQ